MTNKISTNKHGFTIIEVVLVLAIAGLIFLMVFVALPALQRSQRDTQRRNDMSRMATALTNWQTNHQNNLPAAGDANDFLTQYLKQNSAVAQSEFKDPDNTNYTLLIENWSTASGANRKGATNGTTPHQVHLITGATCNGESATSSTGANDYAILYRLEGSGVVCVDNK